MLYQTIMHIDKMYELFQYIEMRRTATTIYEDYYVAPDSVNIEFPEVKRNLIIIRYVLGGKNE